MYENQSCFLKRGHLFPSIFRGEPRLFKVTSIHSDIKEKFGTNIINFFCKVSMQ